MSFIVFLFNLFISILFSIFFFSKVTLASPDCKTILEEGLSREDQINSYLQAKAQLESLRIKGQSEFSLLQHIKEEITKKERALINQYGQTEFHRMIEIAMQLQTNPHDITNMAPSTKFSDKESLSKSDYKVAHRFQLPEKLKYIDAGFRQGNAYVASRDPEHQIVFWNPINKEKFLQLKGHNDSVTCVSFSHDGQKVLSGSHDKTAIIWNAQTGVEIFRLTGHDNAVTSAQFNFDGTMVVTASDDATAILWDAATGKYLMTLAGSDEWLTSARFSPDSQQIVTADQGGNVVLWDSNTGRELGRFIGHNMKVSSAEFSANGLFLVTSSHDRTARVWEVPRKKEIARLTGYQHWVQSAYFSSDSEYVITSSPDQNIRIGSLSSLTNEIAEIEYRSLHNPSLISAVMSPDGLSIIAISNNGWSRLWERISLREALRISTSSDERPRE